MSCLHSKYLDGSPEGDGYKQGLRRENYGHKEENKRKTKGRTKLFNTKRSVLQKFFVTLHLLIDSTLLPNYHFFHYLVAVK